MNGVIDLIARSPEAKASNLSPREMAELIFAVNDGMLMRDVFCPTGLSPPRAAGATFGKCPRDFGDFYLTRDARSRVMHDVAKPIPKPRMKLKRRNVGA